METLRQESDSSEANPSSVKSEEGAPPLESGRGSPPPNCAICLETCQNKSFTDSCLHQFCFTCLLTWSKVKAECPLCKQNFKSIIHNVQPNQQYEEYMVEQRQEEIVERIDIDDMHIRLTQDRRRYRYRATLTFPRSDTSAVEHLLVQYRSMVDVLPTAVNTPRSSPCISHSSFFRRTVYTYNLWANPLPDLTGYFRECSPQFYRHNNAQMHRLVPWLNRELLFLLNSNVTQICYVINRILELLPQHHITSPEFRNAMSTYFRDRTDHFLHELQCFATTPYDLQGYDRNVGYTTDTPLSNIVNDLTTSSESDASADSDVVLVTPATQPLAGPSQVTVVPVSSTYPGLCIPNNTNPSVIPIETISHSDTDDNDDVMVIGYIKPPQDRTPEVVDLLESDSDVILQETVSSESQDRSKLVKLSLKRALPRSHSNSDTDDSYIPPTRIKKRRKRRNSNETATTVDTSRSTPSSELSDSCLSDSSYHPKDSPVRKHKKKKSKKALSKTKTKKPSVKLLCSTTLENNKRKKQKSSSGKGVKTSKRRASNQREDSARSSINEPSTSSTSRTRTPEHPKKKFLERAREGKRLKSVVNMVPSPSIKNELSSEDNRLNILNRALYPNSNIATYNSEVRTSSNSVLSNEDSSSSDSTIIDHKYSESESDDYLPLNLSIKKFNNGQ